MTQNKYDVRLLELTLDVHNRNGTCTITLPKSFTKLLNIKPSNQLTFVATEIRRGASVEELTHLYVKD